MKSNRAKRIFREKRKEREREERVGEKVSWCKLGTVCIIDTKHGHETDS